MNLFYPTDLRFYPRFYVPSMVEPIKMPEALVIGASRGIGKKIATTFAKAGYSVGVASRTVEDTPKLPGTIFTTTKEISDLGFQSQALPIKCNVRKTEDIENAVSTCISHFGSLDVAIYNAGAITRDLVVDTCQCERCLFANTDCTAILFEERVWKDCHGFSTIVFQVF